ncbi:RNA-binding cell elongation regulator Jag/EloR [Tetragenococcus muriaticus]|nr:RNA-binding cell elongation regulator Jag/EloR [Tetragenococcus muriaticus]GMA48188.1 RNA-binding protein Jag [Tetragenococcus muriaticus]
MPIYDGQNTEEAIQNGLRALGVTQDDVKTTILEEGKKGFLGVGKKNARVSLELMEDKVSESQTGNVTESDIFVKESDETSEEYKTVETEEFIEETNEVDSSTKPQTQAKEAQGLEDQEALRQLDIYLTDITKALNAPAMVTTTRDNDRIIFDLDTDKKGILIGHHGKTLNALQYLAQVYVHRIAKNKLSIEVNVGDYRQKRQEVLQKLAEQTAEKVKHTKRAAFLEPMPAFERKQIHSVLSKNKDITTHSEGDEPYRYLVVEPVKKSY